MVRSMRGEGSGRVQVGLSIFIIIIIFILVGGKEGNASCTVVPLT